MSQEIFDQLRLSQLPEELLELIANGSGSAYLHALAAASFDTRYTDLLLPIYHDFAADTAQRWISYAQKGALREEVLALSCSARILPLVPYLKPVVEDFWHTSRLKDATAIPNHSSVSIFNDDLSLLLIALFRLQSHDPKTLSALAPPIFFTSLFTHKDIHVRWLAVQCFGQVVYAADALIQSMVNKYVGDGRIRGVYEGEQIDYRVFKLFEEQRWVAVRSNLKKISAQANTGTETFSRFSEDDLHTRTILLADIVLPISSSRPTSDANFVETQKSRHDLRALASSLRDSRHTLVVGPSGCGKSAIIREAARRLNKLSSLVTLHLNEQTDAKSLLGIYTSSRSGSTFQWQPGVLTQAVTEGRWVLIEDIDRASAEVIGILRPLLENNQLFLSNRKEIIIPKNGFRIFGTVRYSSTIDSFSSRHHMLSNTNLWQHIFIKPFPVVEIEQVLLARHPLLKLFLPSMMSAHSNVQELYSSHPAFKSVTARLPTLRDLLKWCKRAARRLPPTIDPSAPLLIPSSFPLDVLKDGADCYAAHLNDSQLQYMLCDVLAQSLNIARDAAEHVYRYQVPHIEQSKQTSKIGRTSLPRSKTAERGSKNAKFALTRSVKRNMEAIATGLMNQEPLLLVGETGVGKTTIVQQIANSIGQQLTVVNLSNQSEASDLLGGLKPVTTRSLLVPLADEFTALFDDTFSVAKNEKFVGSVSRAFSKQNWPALLKLWSEAVKLADSSLGLKLNGDTENQTPKRQKLDPSRYQALRTRWIAFANKLVQIQNQIRHVESNQVFAFVESRLVQAVRSGQWLLLDEVNLASQETLDSLISLLQTENEERPYLLLAEAGSVERIEAHLSFRVLAAMNPATDTGKKDLPPAVRSYFTELFVHAGDNDVNDLTEIVQTYLGSLLENDKRAATDLAKAYLALKELSRQQKMTDGAGDAPHFSLRSLTRCLQYTQQYASGHGLRRAMYDGIKMSFFTVLSIKSQDLALQAVDTHLMSTPQAKRAISSQRINNTYDHDNYVNFEHYLLLKGKEVASEPPKYITDPKSVRRNLLNLARATSMRKFPILLQGPTSAGKTSMIEYLAHYTKNKFVRINNHEHTDLHEYLGTYTSGSDGKLIYQEGVLVQALRNGYWIVLDELNLAPSDVLEAMNRLLDDNRELLIPESQEIVRPHPGFMLFATQNPAGLYGGRKRLSRAFRNRFLEIHVDDIPEDELQEILLRRANIAPTFCPHIVKIYKDLSLQRQSSRLFEQRSSFATLRDLFRWASRPVRTREELAHQGFMLLGERVREPAEKEIVRNVIEKELKVKLLDENLYGVHHIPPVLRELDYITWTSHARRLFLLVTAALQNDEPVLLVGETGCGKTQICQTIAASMGKQLSIYNAHANTETGDLIGSQRPTRHKSELARSIVTNLSALGPVYEEMRSAENIDIKELIQNFKRMDTTMLDTKAVDQLKSDIVAYESLFTWSDGSLVRAMKEGSHFLLDEISLAGDSVLERMNSLLEPARTVLLAEKGSEDNFVVAQPGFQFLSTMNPGGDYGKRELSAALRNRLTEIWVPPLTEDEDVLAILQHKLKSQPPTVAEAMLKFARFFHSQIEQSNNPTLPLRALLNWADFMTTNTNIGFDAAFVHGAALTYIDSLGTSPAGTSRIDHHDITTARQKCLQYIEHELDIPAQNYGATPNIVMSSNSLNAGVFSLPRSGSAGPVVGMVADTKSTLRNLLRLVRALQTARPILMEGDAGVGKTATVTMLSTYVGKPLTRINLSDQTDLMDLFGADAPAEGASLGQFVWRDGPLLKAMQLGHWVLLDEMNLSTQSVLEGLNACLDHRREVYIAELDQTFYCHPDFRLFATQNPHHQGGGRKGLPASFVNRFTVMYADPLEEEDLLHICSRKSYEVSEEHIKGIVNIISQCQAISKRNPAFSDGGPWELNLRDLSRWLHLCMQNPQLDVSVFVPTTISQRFRSSTARTKVREICEANLSSYKDESLYSICSSDSFCIGTSSLLRDRLFQLRHSSTSVPTDQLQYARSFITAIDQGWPIVLSGATGSGKTTMIRTLAAYAGADLVEFSTNNDIDIADLIGGYEQYDLSRELQMLLVQARKEIIADLPIVEHKNIEPEVALVAFLHKLDHKSVNVSSALADLKRVPLAEETRSKVTQLLQRARDIQQSPRNESARFVWRDGVLVDAITNGSWFVLDNANLCNLSVLDRLNSLLEPAGNLIITEQHNSAGESRVLVPHKNFRIILTTDPRYGELSRPMRNRSCEIFLDVLQKYETDFVLPTYHTDSTLARLRAAVAVVSEHSHDQLENEPSIDQLSFSDLELMQQISAFRTALVPTDDTSAEETVMNCRVGKHMPSGSSSLVNPLVNEPKLDLEASPVYSNHSIRRYRILSVLRLNARCKKLLDGASATISGTEDGKQTFLIAQDMSLKKNRGRKGSKSISILSAFRQVCNSFPTAVLEESVDDNMVQRYHGFSALIFDMIYCFNHSHVDSSRLQAFRQMLCNVSLVGTNICEDLATRSSIIAKALGSSIELRSGQSLQRMWPTWRGKVYADVMQLNINLKLTQLISKFDDLRGKISQPRVQLASIRLRLLETCTEITNVDTGSEQVQMLEQTINELGMTEQSQTDRVGLFAAFFDRLLEKLILLGEPVSAQSLQTYICLGDVSANKTMPVASFQSVLGLLRRLANLDAAPLLPQTSPAAGEIDSQSLIDKLQLVFNQPIGELDLSVEELSQVTKNLSLFSSTLLSNNVSVLGHCTQQIIGHILSAHQELFSHVNQEPIAENDSKTSNIDNLTANTNQLILTDDTTYFEPIYQMYLKPAMISSRAETANECARALILTSLAGLKLLIPDVAFDPSVYPQLLRECYEQRCHEFHSKLAAWKKYTLSTMGQNTSFMIRLIEADFAQLEIVPEAEAVYRPERQFLATLQGEFTNVLRNVVNAAELNTITADNGSVDVQQLYRRIGSCIERLSHVHRAYDDLTEPVVAFLKILRAGLSIYDDSARSNVTVRTAIDRVIVTSLQGKNALDEPRLNILSYKQLWYILSSLRLNTQIARGISPEHRPANSLLDVLNVFYIRWRKQLSEDQKTAEAQSRYYSYRADNDGEDVNDEEVRDFFPTFEGDEQDRQDDQAVDEKVDARSIAIKLAAYHRSIYAQENIKSMLEEHLMQSLHHGSDHVNGPEHLKMVLPALMLAFQRDLAVLEPVSQANNLNIYVGSHLSESRKLFDIVRQTQARFQQIGTRWPDHAVPPDVLRICKQTLELTLSDPVAKLLTKTEKVLETVYQWQQIASSEWSVQNLVDAYTRLIIHWRRLELGSWSRLLDTETTKMQEDADSWYFIAFEAVIYNSAQIVEQKVDISDYCRDLAKTLEEFLRSTTLGQFQSRLGLLKVFAKTLEDMTCHDDRLAPIMQTLLNVTSHYSRFEDDVASKISDGRLALQKNVNEQIKLASWKDTNITALRDSARRSHNKLFRIVKKYRALLSTPITVLQAKQLPTLEYSVKLETLNINADQADIDKHAAMCAESLTSWSQLPDRVKKPVSTTKTMQYMHSSSQPEFSASNHLRVYLEELQESTVALRKATPATTSDENNTLIKDLKQRKRRLLAETMKDLTLMGVRRNIGTAELEMQASSSVIFASIPQLQGSEGLDSYFHELVDIMPTAREAALGHSDELTEGETRRGLGYLEGLLSLILRQRACLSRSRTDSKSLARQIILLENLCSQTKLQASRSAGAQHSFSVESCLTPIPHVLEVFANIVDFQGQQGGFDVTDVVTEMRDLQRRLSIYSQAVRHLQELPLGLESGAKASLYDEAQALLSDLTKAFIEWQARRPEIGYLTSQLQILVRFDDSPSISTNGFLEAHLSTVQQQVINIVNSVFVALQQIAEVTKTLPASSKDQGWLAKAVLVYQQLSIAAHSHQIRDGLSQVLTSLQWLNESGLELARSLLIVVSPIIRQYAAICDDLEARARDIHASVLDMSVYLVKTFTTLAREGFCTPAGSNAEQEQSGKLEPGTGLGEGDAANDISKDVADDEDLNDLAQAGGEREESGQMDKSKDAVDMGVDDLEGDTGSGDEQASDDEEKKADDEDEQDGQDMEEETGSVDDLDPSAVDEKMWDDMQKEAEKEEKEMKSQKQEGQKSDEQAASGAEGEKSDEIDAEAEEGGEEIDEAEDDDGAQRAEGENVEQDANNEQALDLPEDMQLNGEEAQQDTDSDVDMDGLSDVADEPQDKEADRADVDGSDELEQKQPDEELEDETGMDENLDGQAQDDEVVEDQLEEQNEDQTHDTRQDDMSGEQVDATGETGTANTTQVDLEATEDENTPQGENEAQDKAQSAKQQSGKAASSEQEGAANQGTAERGPGQQNKPQSKQDEVLKRLADMLDQYHKRREIFTKNEDRQQNMADQDVDMADVDFEHVDEEEDGQTQALGTAETNAKQDIDQEQAIEDSRADVDQDLPMPEDAGRETLEDTDNSLSNKFEQARKQQEQSEDGNTRSAIVPESALQRQARQDDKVDVYMDTDKEDVDEITASDSKVGENDETLEPTNSIHDAQHLWSMATSRTQSLSTLLTEQLRLILQPTTATKLRGDFRTGKRLNIRRIIPYIASGYKRDKIWMRRSVPSKRNYQVMLAVDDSKSMAENGADMVALETLCMLSRSLSMLEVGQLAIVAFGQDYNTTGTGTKEAVKLAHPFSQPFSPNHSGPATFQHFAFQQRGTNIHNLLTRSLALFREARQASSAREASDLWQLQLIISDGHIGSDADSRVTRLVRQMRQEKIVVVFVIVDNEKESIVDQPEVIFEKDPSGAIDPSTGMVKQSMVTRRYLEHFPFQYYVVVREVRELPNVLCRVLKGWFEGVVEQG